MEAKDICALDSSLENDRATTKSRWQDVVDLFMPSHGNVYTQFNDAQKEYDLIDRTGTDSVRDFSSGIYAHTVNPNQPWFTFRVNDPEFAENQTVQDALTKAAKQLHRLLQNSNLSQALTMLFPNFCGFGIGVNYCDVVDDKFRFNSYSPTCVNISHDEHGRLDTVLRTFKNTAKQAYGRWGEECSDKVKQAAKSNDPVKQNEKFEFLHAVMKRPDSKRDLKAKNDINKPWASYYVEKGEKKIVHEGGYDTMPYFVTRFYPSEDGTVSSPAIDHIDTMAMLCKVSADIAEFAEAALYPPLFTDDEEGVADNKLSMRPRALNYYNSKSGTPPFTNAPQHGAMQPAILWYEKKSKEVRDAFFADLFLQEAQDNPNMTATEVIERKNERLSRISPVVVQLESELYQPMIERCLSLALEKGWVEPFPDELRGVEYQVHYTNKLSSMLSRNETQATVQAFMECASVAEAAMNFPLMSELLDIDKMFETIMESHNVDPDITRDPKEVQAIREAQQAAMEQQQQAELQSKAVKPIDPNAPVQKGSPLAEMREAS